MSEWQPIETAPKDGQWVLGWAPGWLVVSMAWFHVPGKVAPHWTTGRNERPIKATHWMPLPPPPRRLE